MCCVVLVLHYEGKWEGVGPWKSRLFWPQIALAFRLDGISQGPKKSQFPGTIPLSLAFVMDAACIKSITQGALENIGVKIANLDETPLLIRHLLRYRSILKRLEGVEDQWMKNSLVVALGGFTTRTRYNLLTVEIEANGDSRST